MIRVNNDLPKFAEKNADAMDRALNRIAIDILLLSKQKVPWKEGLLSASGITFKGGRMKYKVEYNKVYAAYQEFGGDGVRRVLNYSRAGRGAHYLKDSGDEIKKKAVDYFKQEANNIRI